MPSDLVLLLPEISMVAAVASLALIEIFYPSFSHRFTTELNGIGLLGVGVVLAGAAARMGTAFQGSFVADPFSFFFKFLFLASATCVLIMKRQEAPSARGGEFYLLLWASLLGMFFLVSSRDFLLFFISLELLTLSLYILAAYTERSLPAIEAGLKYLILGSLASAFLLYGVSLIYAASGTFSFEGLGEFVRRAAGEGGRPLPLLLVAGILLVFSALAFKVAAVPFQVWVPDVYEGAPTPVVAFLSVASKAAGFAAFQRIFFETLGPLGEERRLLFSLLASLTLLYGNLGALVQKNMKRLLGFSSNGHAGFPLIALASPKELAGQPFLYYLVAYAISNLTAFLVVSIVENAQNPRGETQDRSLARGTLEDYQGLWRRSPLLAAGMFLAFLSLAGVPPLAGFFGKFFILLAAAKGQLFWLVFLGAVNVAISLYYYLSVIRILYFEEAKEGTPISVSPPSRLLLWSLMVGIVLVGVWQAPLFRIVSRSAFHL